MQRDFPVTIAETAAATRWIEDIAAANGLPGATAYAMQLCLEELLGNILRHGSGNRRAKVAVALLSDRVRMTVEDDGAPFNVVSAPVKHVQGTLDNLEPGGLGIGLVHDFSTSLEYARAGLGNLVTMTFELSDPVPPATPRP